MTFAIYLPYSPGVILKNEGRPQVQMHQPNAQPPQPNLWNTKFLASNISI